MNVSIEEWRKLYDIAATEGNWVRAHRWGHSPEVAMRTIEDIRKKLRVGRGDRILEVGCGSGMVLQALLHEGQSGIGVDLCENLLRQADVFGVDRQRVKVAVAEAARLPFAADTFDRVLCYSVFQCLPTVSYASQTLKELVRVCRAGGTILVGDVFGHWERLQATWHKERASLETVRAALSLPLLRPVWYTLIPVRAGMTLLRRLRGNRATVDDEDTLPRRHYSHAFFRRFAEKHGYELEILGQSIFGRDISSLRFDVRIAKRND